MNESEIEFTLQVAGTRGTCPAGDGYAARNEAEGKIPVFSCEGPCIRGEIARVAANLVAKEEPYRRACHAEVFTVPQSGMASWAKSAREAIVIDGCFLRCHGRILRHLIGKGRLVEFDAHPFYKRYTDVFEIDAVPEPERMETARLVARRVLDSLAETGKMAGRG